MKFIVEADSVEELISALEQLIAARKTTPDADDSIDRLNLTVRSHNCMIAENIRTVGHLTRHTRWDLLKIPNFGKRCLDEVEAKLAAAGLRLAQ